jgi:hypothetical protein
MLMHRRIGFAWAVAGSASLAFLLVLACHPVFAVAAPAGMSAPAAPARTIDSAPAAQLLQSFTGWHGLTARAFGFALALVALRTAYDARQDAKAVPPHYGPLHRRPPPSFS